MSETTKRKYDLEERTAKFGENGIELAKNIQKNVINSPLINQFVKSVTSVGANYCEANCAETKKDFIHKIGICKKEANETRHWLRMIKKSIPELEKETEKLSKEANELQLIFVTIIRKSREN